MSLSHLIIQIIIQMPVTAIGVHVILQGQKGC